MKRLLFTGGLASCLLLSLSVQAQERNGFDDVYYTGSQARQDAKKAKKQQISNAETGTEYYNSSNSDYQSNQGAEPRSGQYYEEQSNYIDYDDDSYTTRIRRFNYPMAGSGYWGSVYSPYWMDPFYSSPWGWGYPGMRFSISFGYGSYWGGYPYGGFYSGWGSPYGYGWGYPMYGYGMGGYYSGFWNGYYTGLYDGSYAFNNPYRRNYGPRGARNRMYTGNNNNRTQRISPVHRRTNVDPESGRTQRISNLNRGSRNNQAINRNSGRRIELNRSNPRVINNNKVEQRRPSGNNSIRTEQPATRRNSGLFNSRRTPQRAYNARPARNQRSYQAPSRRSAPSVRPSRSAPSRSFSAPSSSGRSSGASRGGGRR